jgi:hypothetical protein
VPTVEQWALLRGVLGLERLDAEVWRLNGRKGTPGEAWEQRAVLDVIPDRWAGKGEVLERANQAPGTDVKITAPATLDAARWDGWNTSLKPAHEPIVLARKPLSGTVATTVLEHGTGALNIGACRVAGQVPRTTQGQSQNAGQLYGADQRDQRAFEPHAAGRWPANVLLSHLPECGPEEDPQPCAPGCVVTELDAQSGTLRAGERPAQRDGMGYHDNDRKRSGAQGVRDVLDSGGASRFYPTFRYQAKAPTSERPKIDGKGWPTVKPLALMQWLVRLATPLDGTVLDPFAGTATTLQAAQREGFSAIGIERDPLALALGAQRLGIPVPAPVLRAQLPSLQSPTLLDLVRQARDMSTLVLLYRAHCGTWSDEVNDAARERRRQLESAAVSA